MPELQSPIPHTVEAIYRSYEAQPRHERSYLGASTLGAECDRALWYGFRLAHDPEQFDGRKLRLFETGNLEEDRVIQDLRAAGLTVHDADHATGRQWSIAAIGGHFRGHLDGIVWGVLEAPKAEHVLEIKTHNEKSFRALTRDGVEKSKPGHFAQMQLYMHHRGVARALYVAVCKNTDEIHIERVAYDMSVAARLMARIERIIRAETAPPKLHADPASKAAFSCQWCPASGVCHDGQFARRNCRTCISASAVIDASDRGAWRCELHDRDLSFADQRAGCPSHRYLPSIVSGDQIDASETDRTVTYRLASGETWIDGGAA